MLIAWLLLTLVSAMIFSLGFGIGGVFLMIYELFFVGVALILFDLLVIGKFIFIFITTLPSDVHRNHRNTVPQECTLNEK
jgi:hypothetical protein